MEFNISTQGAVTTAKLIGLRATPAAHECAPALGARQEKAGGTIILDCKQLTYISSSGLRIFLTLRKAAVAKGGKVIVRSICPDIRNVFVMTGFLNLFEMED